MTAEEFPIVPLRTDGWGPTSVPSGFESLPYTPFSKSDRISKIADWTNPSSSGGQQYSHDQQQQQQQEDSYGRNRRRFGVPTEAFGTGMNSLFSYQIAADDEANFSTVDRATAPRSKVRGGGGPAKSVSWSTSGRAGRGEGFVSKRRMFGRGGMHREARVRDPSIKVGAHWSLIEEMDFPRLSKLYYDVQNPEDLAMCGNTHYYDKNFDRINVKNETVLQGSDIPQQNVTTSEDPMIKEMAKKSKKATVFATESILAVLMASVRSVYGWDMTITKQGNNLFLDKRDGGIFDLISVNENATDAPTDDEKSINSALALSMEATYVNRSYASQVLSASETVQFPQGNPLAAQAASGQVPPAVYRYRKWDLGSDVDLIVRTRLDAALQQQGESELSSSFKSSHSPAETQFLTLRTLLEYDSRVANTPDWRQKLDSMKGAVLATEFKNNSFKLSRWVIESVLSGADQLRIGFVSRLSPKDRKRHTLLGTGVFKPFDFLAQLNFDIFSGWGIVKTLVTMLMENHPDGKYVLMKDPNKPQLLLYAVPASSEPTEA